MSTIPQRTAMRSGLRASEGDAWSARGTWRYERRRRTVRTVLVAGLAVALLVLTLAVAIARAAGHYEEGRQAMAQGQFSRAAAEFAAARILVVPYRDAAALEDVARRQSRVRPGPVPAALAGSPAGYDALVATTLRHLLHERYLAAAESVRQLRSAYPDYPLSFGPHGPALVAAAGEALLLTAQRALREGEPGKAVTYAAAALVLQPGWFEALALRDSALAVLAASPAGTGLGVDTGTGPSPSQGTTGGATGAVSPGASPAPSPLPSPSPTATPTPSPTPSPSDSTGPGGPGGPQDPGGGQGGGPPEGGGTP